MCEFWSAVTSFLNAAFVSSIAGGLLGGLFTYLGVRLTINHEKQKNLAAEKSEVNAFCKAIYAELDSILSRYLFSIGDQIGKHRTDQPFLFFYSVGEEYFTVFNSNAHLLGKVEDDELRSRIVRIYTFTKGHLDSLRMNNAMLAEVKALAPIGHFKRDDPQFIKYQNALAQLTAYAPTLVKSHADLVTGIEETLRKLKAAQDRISSAEIR